MFPDLGSQYKFIRKLGSGGTGVVNLALDQHTGFLVAVKTLFTRHIQDKEVLNKFQAEANIYLMLNHPNIVSLKNFIIRNNKYHLVQEYVAGQTLDSYIRNVTGPIPIDRSLEIITDIVSAINYAHNKNIPLKGYDGVLHLDIKPSNILISENGKVKIIDYGISQGNKQERGKKIMGSPMYMAPEQFDHESKLDKRTDIYALGILFHQMITGSKPYCKTTTLQELKDKIYNDPLDRIVDLYPGCEIRAQEIIDNATQKNPENRFQSCEELIESIENLKNEL